jgi:hypothetical protein
MPNYVEFTIDASYFQNALSATPPKSEDRIYNQELISHLSQQSLEFMKQIELQVNSKTYHFTNDTSTHPDEFYQNVLRSLSHNVAVDKNSLISVYAVALYKYSIYKWWFERLKQSITFDSKSSLVLELKEENNILVIHYIQKEKRIGNFRDKNFLTKETEFKVKQFMSIAKQTYKLIVDGNIILSISQNLWKKELEKAGIEYLNQCGEILTEENIIVMVPFLNSTEFLNKFSSKYANQIASVQHQIQHYINLCFEKNQDEHRKILNTLTVLPARIILPVTPAPTVVITANKSKTGARLTEEKTVPNVQRIFATTEEEYEATYSDFLRYVEVEQYEVSQAANLKNLARAIANLSEKQRKSQLPLLIDLMKSTIIAIKQPENTNNLTHCLTLIEPLKRKVSCNLALTFAAVIIGALIVAASVAVAIASFGGATILSSIGIAVGTSLLAKAVSITAGAIGLTMIVSSVGLFARQKFKPIINYVEDIQENAVKYNAHQIQPAL